MPRPITAVIHQDALLHNLNVARQFMPQSKVFTVVKANAYGHGIERVYDALNPQMVLLCWISMKQNA